MSVLPFPRDAVTADGCFSIADEFDDVDDVDESLNRYGSFDRTHRVAHRVINPSVLSAVTGFPPIPCQEFHHVLFDLLEAIGDYGGLIATPLLCVGRSDALPAAHAWLAAHPAVDVDAIREADHESESDDELWCRIKAEFEAHSLALAVATGTNPSLTFGSIEALSERLSDEVLEIAVSCMPQQITELTETALELIARLPESVNIVGNPGRSTCLTRDTFRGWQA
jgi:hypothetical protein